jgi:hypothetical protein
MESSLLELMRDPSVGTPSVDENGHRPTRRGIQTMMIIANDIAQAVRELASAGGPPEEDWPRLTAALRSLYSDLSSSPYRSSDDLAHVREAFGGALSLSTLQGHSYEKPYGYPGDFEIIDRIHTRYVSDDDRYRNWDLYFQAQCAPSAVRNRGRYFEALLGRLHSGASVLNLACGGCREVANLHSRGELNVSVDCVDQDPNALEYARGILDDAPVSLQRANAFRWEAPRAYDLVWSAGLFDYLDADAFVFLLRRLWKCVKLGGSLVVGNFAPNNPTRPYMEIVGDWVLNYRDAEDLVELARRAGIPTDAVSVDTEAEGVNLFLWARR